MKMVRSIVFIVGLTFFWIIGSAAQIKTVKQVRQPTQDNFCTSKRCREWAPYLRLGEDTWGPIYWLVAFDGSRCEVDGMTQASIKYGQSWECEWKRPW